MSTPPLDLQAIRGRCDQAAAVFIRLGYPLPSIEESLATVPLLCARIAELEAENRTLQARLREMEKLAALGAKVLDGARSQVGSDVSGGDVQDWALESGALVTMNATEPCGDYCQCAEWDDFPQPCYRIPETIQTLMSEWPAPSIVDEP